MDIVISFLTSYSVNKSMRVSTLFFKIHISFTIPDQKAETIKRLTLKIFVAQIIKGPEGIVFSGNVII